MENTQEIDRAFAILIAKITFKQIKKRPYRTTTAVPLAITINILLLLTVA